MFPTSTRMCFVYVCVFAGARVFVSCVMFVIDLYCSTLYCTKGESIIENANFLKANKMYNKIKYTFMVVLSCFRLSLYLLNLTLYNADNLMVFIW